MRQESTPRLLYGLCSTCEGGWGREGDHSRRGVGEFQENDAPEAHPRRINTKQVLVPKDGDTFMFPLAGGGSVELASIRPHSARY